MKEQEYIKNILENQIDWHSNKSILYKKWLYSLRTSEIILASISPVLFYYSSTTKQITPVLSALIAISTSTVALFKFQELWVSYRTTSESLKRAKNLYETNTCPYNTESKFNLLVKNVEQIISDQNNSWKERIFRRNT